LYRNRNARVDGGRANTNQPWKGAAKDDEIFRIPRYEHCPAGGTKTHVFVRAISSTGIFNRAIPPAGFQNDTDASTNEQFVRESAHNDQHGCFEKNAPTYN
jgi:hypothetical protein